MIRYKANPNPNYFLALVTLLGIPEGSAVSIGPVVATAARVFRTGAGGIVGGVAARALLEAVGAVKRDAAAARVALLGAGADTSSTSVLLFERRDATVAVARVRVLGFSGSGLSAF